MKNFDSWVIVGKIIKSIGLRGQIKIISFCENPNSIVEYNPILLESSREAIFLSLVKCLENNLLIVNIDSVDSKELADKLVGCQLYADKTKFPLLSDSEYYFSDLESCVVYDMKEKIFGKIQGIYNFGAGELLEIYKFEDSSSFFVHFNEKNFPVVNILKKMIFINFSK